MRFQRKVIIFFTVFTLIFFIVRELILFNHELDMIQEKTYAKNRTHLELILNLQEKAVESMALQLSLDPSVIDAYKKKQPQKLIEHLTPFWKTVKNRDLIHEIHFFQPPATTFVNFSNFKAIGTDVSRIRSDFAWVTSSFTSGSHIMMCKTYAGVRATYPILDANEDILGGVSLGKKLDWIPATMKEFSGRDSFLVYTKESTEVLGKKYYEKFMKGKVAFGNFILADRTLDIPTQSLKNLNFNQQHHRIKHKDQEYILNLYPRYDFNDKIIVYIAILENLTPFYTNFYNNLFMEIIIILAIAIIGYFIVRLNISSVIKRINYIADLTKKYQNKNFKSLEKIDMDVFKELKGDEISQLQYDVMEMGYELNQYYNNLEGQVAEKEQKVKVLNNEVNTLLYIDRMTGMSNRNSLAIDLNTLKIASLAIININSFKNINDLYGIENGNTLLIKVAKAIETFAKQHGVKHIYTLGGDETALLLEEDNPHDLHKICLALVEKLESTIFRLQEDEIEVRMDFSIGISRDSDYILERADMALNDAKSKRKSVVVYQEKTGVRKQYEENLALFHKINYAVHHDGIILHYQPIVNKAGTIIKYEALVRMIDGEKVLSPYHFLEFSKQTKYYEHISKMVINQSFEMFKEEKKSFSINLTQTDILQSSIRNLILEKLNDKAFDKRVIIELVESENLDDVQAIDAFIAEVKQKGAQIAIDDFGSGYSNFSYLLRMQPDYLKIDGSLIKNIDSSENSLAIVKAIVGFAKELNIKTIAEYVHSQEIYEIVLNLGIDEFQGFYFFEPSATLQT